MPLIPSTIATPPPPASYAPGRPVLAATAALLGGDVNGLVGWTALRSTVVPFQRDADDGSDTVLETDPWRWRWRPSAAAQWVALDIWYLAEATKGPSMELTAYLLDADGDPIDGPVTWSTANNLLPRSSASAVPFRSRDLLVTTGWSTRSVAGFPRMLELPGTRAPVQVELQATAVRPRSMTIIEAFQAVL